MRGILSATPSPGPIRLLIGSQMLLLIQAGLVLCCEQSRAGTPAFAARAVVIVGIVSLLLAIAGEPRTASQPQRRAHPGAHERIRP